MKPFVTLFVFCCMFAASLSAQDAAPLIHRYLLDNQQKLQLSKTDVDNWKISDQYISRHNQVTHAYVQQTLNGLNLYNAVSSVAIKNDAVVVFNSRFTPNAAQMANASPGMEQLSPRAAVEKAAANVEIPLINLQRGEESANPDNEWLFTAAGSVRAPIKVSMLYQKTDESIHLAWNVEIQANSDWWNIRVEALTGEILDKNNYTIYCDFEQDAYAHTGGAEHSRFLTNSPLALSSATAKYRVFPFPGESPSHVSHQLLSDPSDVVASPYGWHDTDGQPGPEYTITRGNNVYASEDRNDSNNPGYSPDGGINLEFDFPYIPSQDPTIWEDAAITNLFYANNILHDMTYRFGFDEVSGNFQENNYGLGGEGNDFVNADAQDGSGTNNANFSTPPDGENSRMQMYIWDGGGGVGGDSMRVNMPANIAGTFWSPSSLFGPDLLAPLTGDVVLVVDETPPTADACQTIVNAAQLSGKIALILRGGPCLYTTMVKAAQDAGAIAVIVYQNSFANPFEMPGADTTISIYSVMISRANGQSLLGALDMGPVNVTLLPFCCNSDLDSDIDNGIIAHEFGHGISNRLTGGPSNTGCLNNAEQMGEGWGDYYALITTIHPTDTRTTPRSVGTYVLNEPNNGDGIRNKLYTTDMNVNDYTYGSMPGTGGEVHNTGEIWATMLWDLTWDLIDAYGFEPDLTLGTGGNNIAQQLVTDGMKLQPCSPGYVDGRDAILQADMINYNGANQCLIWAAFARRGLGFSADQGNPFIYNDGVEAFDLAPLCLTAVEAPIADFSVDRNSRCLELATFSFSDSSENLAQYWLWDFGDGNTSNEKNPSHTYTSEGIFTVSLIVSNNIGADTLVIVDMIAVSSIPPLTVDSVTICVGDSASLTATLESAGNTAKWTDLNGVFQFEGTTFNTPILTTTTTYSVYETEIAPIQNVGPTDFGNGANHASNFGGKVIFTAKKPLTILSVLVRAEGAGDREIKLYNGSGDVMDSVTVNIPDGDSRIDLNMKVPAAGFYSLGAGAGANLFRTNSGTVYPFDIPGLISIAGASGGNQSRYYYFFDWEVQETPCRSSTSDVTVTVIPEPIPIFSSSNNLLTVSFTDLSTGNPSTILWDFGDGNTSMETNPVHTYATSGVYNVVLTVSNGICTNELTQTIGFITGLNTLNQDQFGVTLAPNPATNSANLTLSGTPGGQNVQLSLYSADGRLMQFLDYDLTKGAIIPLDLNGLAAGFYLVKVEAVAGVVVRKLVVE